MNGIKRRTQKKAEHMQKKMDHFSARNDEEINKLKRLNSQITFLRAEVSQNRSKLKFTSSISAKVYYGHNAVKQNLESTKLQLRNLEQRLHHALLRNNEALLINNKKRARIELVRQKLLVSKMTQASVKKQFEKQKTNMAVLLQRSNTTNFARDELATQIAQVYDTEELDIDAFRMEMESLVKYIQEQKDITNELKAANAKDQSGKKGNLTKEEEMELRNEIRKANEGISKVERKIKKSQRVAMNFSGSFSKLFAESGLTETHELVQLFIAREDEIFSLYSLQQSLRNDLVGANQAVAQSMAEMQKHYDAEGQSQEKQMHMLSAIRAQRRSLINVREQLQAKMTNNTQLLNTWSETMSKLVTTMINNPVLMGSEHGFILQPFVQLAAEYKARTGHDWALPEGPETDEIEELSDKKGHRETKRTTASSPTRKAHGAASKPGAAKKKKKKKKKKKGNNSDAMDGEKEAQESDQNLVSPQGVMDALGIFEGLSRSVTPAFVLKAPSLGFKEDFAAILAVDPRRKPGEELRVTEQELPCSIVDPDNDFQDQYDAQPLDLQAYRDELMQPHSGNISSGNSPKNHSQSSGGNGGQREGMRGESKGGRFRQDAFPGGAKSLRSVRKKRPKK